MTALGFVGMVIGWVLFKTSRADSKLEDVGGYTLCVGAVLFCCGVFIWLWKVMP